MADTKVKTANHPPAIDMIKNAIKSSEEKKGMSLIHIKKYIMQHYPINIEKYAPFLRRAIAHGASKGLLVRVGNKGKGASGTFRLPLKKDELKKEVNKKIINKPAIKKDTIKKVKLQKENKVSEKKTVPKKVVPVKVEEKKVLKKREKVDVAKVKKTTSRPVISKSKVPMKKVAAKKKSKKIVNVAALGSPKKAANLKK